MMQKIRMIKTMNYGALTKCSKLIALLEILLRDS